MGSEFPLTLGTPEQFATLRAFLDRAGFDERSLCAVFDVEHLYYLFHGFGLSSRLTHGVDSNGEIACLVRYFLAGEALPAVELHRWIPEPVHHAMRALGLVQTLGGDPSRSYCPVILHPFETVYLASDRRISPEGVEYGAPDIVMLALSGITQSFAAMVPRTPCERFLDLGTGSGAMGLLAAGFAKEVWATDITERAVAYAEFNRRLNGASNVTVVRGDLFAPLQGVMFDRIATDPPFEPPVKPNLIYSVGGEDGEAIIRRLLESLHLALAPGGRLYGICLGTDRENDPVEARLRRYLGPHAEEFDLALLIRQEQDPRSYALEATAMEGAGAEKLERWADFFLGLRAQSVVYAHFLVQRRSAPRPVFTVRRKFGPQSGVAQAEWLLDWMTRSMTRETDGFILEGKPALAPHAELIARHGMQGGELVPRSYTLNVKHPFEAQLQCPSWMARMASQCDGRRTGRELAEMFHQASGARSLEGLAALAAGGFVTLSGHEPPP